jgi:hypothetical protein
MKMILNKFSTLGLLVLLILTSCEKDEVKVVATAGTAATLSASATTLMLTKANADKPAVTFSFLTPSFGFDAAVTNTLQIDVKGNNFAKAKEIAFDAGVLSKMYSVIDFNAFLLAMNLKTGENSQIEARLKSQITGSLLAPVYSSIIALTVNPYALTSFLYVPGAYQGWTPNTADSLLSSTSNGVYVGVINYTPGNLGFKILTKKAWGPPEYGKGSAAGTIAIGGGDLSAPNAGSLKVTADLNANTIAFEPLLWSIIGDAPQGSNWTNDIVMNYDNGKQIWSATVTMGVGGFKFRKNRDWVTNFGDKTGDLILDTENDNNIKITSAGSYRVVLNLLTNSYTIIKL